LFIHSLCWKHVERPFLKVVCYTDHQRQILDQRLKDFWGLYKDLKIYKLNPTLFDKEDITSIIHNLYNFLVNILYTSKYKFIRKKGMFHLLDYISRETLRFYFCETLREIFD